jgi:hypothetical protein
MESERTSEHPEATRCRSLSRRLAISALALAFALGPAGAPAARAASPAPLPANLAPEFKQPLHAVVTVEVNKKGQVIKVRSIKNSPSESWNTNVYLNAQQMFIRQSDGSAIAGVYDVTYDYDPKAPVQTAVSRKIALVQPGGVDADAPGWVDTIKAEQAAASAHARASAPPGK